MQMQWRATAVILAGVFAQTDISLAAGAIAVGRPPDVAKRGISMGFSTNRDTMDDAKDALDDPVQKQRDTDFERSLSSRSNIREQVRRSGD
jgi:hypothetical protein